MYFSILNKVVKIIKETIKKNKTIEKNNCDAAQQNSVAEVQMFELAETRFKYPYCQGRSFTQDWQRLD